MKKGIGFRTVSEGTGIDGQVPEGWTLNSVINEMIISSFFRA